MTAATAALDPEPLITGSGTAADADDDTVTVSWADFKAWEHQLTTCTHPIRIRHASEIGDLRCSAHYRAMITTAWQLGSRQATGDPRFRAWAHMLGYGGHFLTKSRRYSVTFGQLRAARTDYRRAQRHPDGEHDPWGRPLDESVVLILSTWTYAGTGRNTATPGAELAAASAARAREHHGPPSP